MRARDLIFNQVPSFESKLYFARLTTPYDNEYNMAKGYLAGAEFCLECSLDLPELEAYIEAMTKEKLDEYDKGYLQAIKDYVKEVK